MKEGELTKLLWKLNPRDGGWFYEVVYRYEPPRSSIKVLLRVEIFIHYEKEEASYLRVKAFDKGGLQWNMLVNNPLTPENSLWQALGDSKPEMRWFAEDAEKLIEEALLILRNA